MARPVAPKPGTRKLSEVARLVVKPSGITATGWPAVRDTCREKLGVGFDRWQDGAARLILAEREDGKLAAMVGGVGMSLPRQVGKTYLLAGLIFGLCINRPGLLVIWSAHHAKTHGETFIAMQAFADRLRVKAYVDKVYTGSGDEEIRFHNGSRILFGAREHGFGRGIPGVDVLVMDEAQILSDKALENMLATLNTSSFGLQLYIGTPPKPGDNSEAFTRMREEAKAAPDGLSEDAVWIECGADPDCDPHDRKQWAIANPSHPHRTPVESILRLVKRLKLDGFLREGLGVWDEDQSGDVFGGAWFGLGDPELQAPPPAVIGLSVSHDRRTSAIAGAVLLESGAPALGAIDRRSGTGWLVAAAKKLQADLGVRVVLDGTGPAADLAPALEAAGVEILILKAAQVPDAAAGIYDRVASADLLHADDPELAESVLGAVKTNAKRWTWDQRRSTDLPMLDAATVALWALLNDDGPSVPEIW